MHVLHPIFLLGLAAAAIPLLIHVLRHRRVKRIRFSTLAFLNLIQQRHSLRIRINQILLLVARVALAVVIVLLFAQPYFTIPGLTALNSGPRLVVAVLDNSGSMGLGGTASAGGVALYQESTEQLRTFVSGLSAREMLLVVGLAPRARVTFRGKPEDFTAQQLPQLSAAAADVEGARRLVATALAERSGSERQVAIFSDYCRLPLAELAKLESDMILFPVRKEGLTNHAAGPIVLDSSRLAVGETATLRLTIGRYGAPREAAVTLKLDGEVVDRRVVPAGTGPAPMVFTVRGERPGMHAITVSLSPDALAGDDESPAAIEVVEQRRVQLVTGRAPSPGEGVREPYFFLRRALAGAAIGQSEAPERLEGAALVVLVRPDLLTPNGARDVLRYARRGGNVMVCLGPDEVDAGAANRLFLEPLGLVKIGRKVEGAAPWRAASGKGAPGLVDPRFWEGVASTARFLLEPLKGFRPATVQVAFDDGSPALVVAPVDAGTVALLAAGPGLEASDLPLHPIFPVFLSRLVAWTGERTSVHTAGHEVALTAPVEEGGVQFSVTAPGGRVFPLVGERRGQEMAASFTRTEQPGLYRIDRLSGGARMARHFVVQWPESESVMEFPSSADLLRQAPRARLGGEGGGPIAGVRLPIGLQDLLIAAVVLLMLLESWLVFDLERQISRRAAEGRNE